MRVGVLKFEALPVLEDITPPDESDDVLTADDVLLVEELTKRGVEAESLSWQNPRVAAGEFDAVVLRSTWDYIEHLDRFLDTLQAAERAGAMVLNPLKHVRWNSKKTYLFDLVDQGWPTVPVYSGDSTDWREGAKRWEGAVVKPLVGAGGKDVRKVSRIGEEDDLRHSIVQPFVPSVETEGEWSYIYLGGEFSHAMIKRARPGDFRAHSIYGGTIELAHPDQKDVEEVDAIAARLPRDVAYARIDLLRHEGRLAVIELELIEPVLYMKLVPGAAARLADAVLAMLD